MSWIKAYLENFEGPFLVYGSVSLSRKDVLDALLAKQKLPSPFESIGETLSGLFYEKQFFLKERQELPRKFDTEIICWSSGSSGEPKAIVHTPETLLASVQSGKEFFGYKINDIHGLCLPLEHMAGFMIFLRALVTGGAVRIMEDNIRQWNKSPLTHLSVVSHQLEKLLEWPLVFKDFKSLLVGGGSCSQDLLDRASRQNLPIFHSYGLSEFATTVAVSHRKDESWKTSILPNKKLSLNEGVVTLEGSSLCKGYFHKMKWNEISSPFVTNDIAEWENERLIIKGRNDRIINSGGLKISLVEIENLIKAFAKVECKVIDVPDEKFGQRPIAFLDKEIDQVSTNKKITEMLGKYAVPDC